MKFNRYDPVELRFIAENYLRKGDYENAARFFRYLMVHFRMAKDNPNYRKFAIKAGECYMRAAEKVNSSAKAVMLYHRAVEAFQEAGSTEMIHLCSSKMWESYAAMRGSKFGEDSESLHAFKIAGDYFMDSGDFKKAAIIYQDIAEKALKSGRLLLAGGLYRDVGVCHQRMDDLNKAVDFYVRAADLYFKCQEYFEAAWNYCRAGFLLIRLRRLKEASDIAERAELACHEGQMEIFLRDLSYICKLLSQGLVYEAEENWKRIKWKFNRKYIQLVEDSFQAAK